ncbi:MAG: hypothetical protein GY821_01960 [Gammaproteobacteria bacterium]|nr:hypothetical protein [Gammaproteobacteria bacterium]
MIGARTGYSATKGGKSDKGNFRAAAAITGAIGGGKVGFVAGAACGALIGSVVPGVGTAAGALIGALVGGLLGITIAGVGRYFGRFSKQNEQQVVVVDIPNIQLNKNDNNSEHEILDKFEHHHHANSLSNKNEEQTKINHLCGNNVDEIPHNVKDFINEDITHLIQNPNDNELNSNKDDNSLDNKINIKTNIKLKE